MHISSVLFVFHSKYEPKCDPDNETRKTDIDAYYKLL